MSDEVNKWVVDTDYVTDDIVICMSEGVQYNEYHYKALSAHTSLSFATDFGNGLWKRLAPTSVVAGPQGGTGLQGAKGDTGNTGAKGDTGSAGVFTDIASQAEAEAGTDNTKGMSPLRVAQAIAAQMAAIIAQVATNVVDIAANAVDIAANSGLIASINARVNTLETISPAARTIGEQRLINNSGPTDIEGFDVFPDGDGHPFLLTNTGAKSARVHVEMYRKDDAETRFTTCVLLMHFLPSTNQWYIERESTTAIVGDPDGVTFDIGTTNPSAGVYVGLVNYTTDNMVGGNYDIDSKVKYMIQELSDTF